MNLPDRDGATGPRRLGRLRAALLRLARRAWAKSERQDVPPPYHAAPLPPLDPDAPSERIALAYELARRRVPANWIAARCALPYAFAELIVAEVADTPGTAPRRRD
ncbi:MAG TPA: hypothetical protein VL551_21430 [Actinospica sp.]|nr:hypothetical protein [Actinospica sp.]